MELSLSNVVNVSVAVAQRGAGKYNTSNLAIFTHEAYDLESFGDDGYKIYLGPSEVGEDFGTASQTYKQALKVFSQSPNILAGDGYLVIIPIAAEVQSVSFPAAPVSGVFKLNYGILPTANINWDDTAAQIQTKLRAVAGLEGVVVSGNIPDGLEITFYGVYGDIAALTVSDNTLSDGVDPVVPVVAEVSAGKTIAQAITASLGLVQFFGIIGTKMFSEADGLAAAAVVQPENKMLALVSNDPDDTAEGGYLDLIRSGGYSHTRAMYRSGNAEIGLGFIASYMSRLLSVDFTGSNTTITMHLKDLVTEQPDLDIDQTLLTQLESAGVDAYISLEGVPKLFTSGENFFSDQVYNLLALVGDLRITYFNYLATTSTKITQTEQGMDGLKSALDAVFAQYVKNGYIAPGKWNSPDTFGNQADFLANIEQVGYYMYSTPISKQAQADREERKAPLIQCALKEAGAIHKGSVIIFVNA